MPDLFISKEEKNKALNKNSPSDLDKTFLNQTPGENKSQVKKEEVKDFEKRINIPRREGPLSSFNYLPERINFENKDPEERIILFLRKHPITNVPWVLITFALIILPSFLTVMPLHDEIPPKWDYFILIWYLSVTAYVLEVFTLVFR
jgi:hypothetical protein